MKSPIALFFLTVFFAVTAVGQEQNGRELLLRSADSISKNKAFTYAAKYRIKYFDNTDTTEYLSYNCDILKVPTDTVLGYYARLFNQNEERIYNGYEFLMIGHDRKSVLKDSPPITGKKFARNNIRRECIPSFLSSEKPFSGYLADGTDWHVSEVILDATKVWKLDFSLPTNEEITLLNISVYLDAETMFPVRVETFAKFQDIQDEYSEVWLKNLRPNHELTPDSFASLQYPDDYKVDIFMPSTMNFDLLKVGTPFIPFEAIDLNGTTKRVDESTRQGEIILLDFWHLACAPCLRAMPKLEELYKKYSATGLVVYGLNTFDNPTQKQETLQKFKAKMDISYPLLFSDKELASNYLVKSFPTIYLLKDGKIIYAKVGYTEESMKELEQVIVENINN